MTIAGKAIATMRTARIIEAMGTASSKLAYRPRTSNGSTVTTRAGSTIVTHNRNEVESMENRMRDVMSRNNIPSEQPFDPDRVEQWPGVVATTTGRVGGSLIGPRTSNGSTATTRAGRDIVAPTTGMKWKAWRSACGT